MIKDNLVLPDMRPPKVEKVIEPSGYFTYLQREATYRAIRLVTVSVWLKHTTQPTD